MSEDRKQPGVAFWATVVVVALLAYPASYGPAEWLYARNCLPRLSAPVLRKIYWPMLWVRTQGPQAIGDALEWYSRVGQPHSE